MKMRTNSEFTVLKHIWAALFFVLVWLQLPHARLYIHVSALWIWLTALVVVTVTAGRTLIAVRRPSSKWLRLFPFFDIVVISLAIRYTGGLESDLWLFYYLQILAGALDPKIRNLQVIAPLVIVGYLAAVYPNIQEICIINNTNMKDQIADHCQVIVTRMFFLFVAGAMARYIATGREMISRELTELNEQLTVAEERNRIARELHDGVGHSLVNSVLNIELCHRLIDRDPEEAKRMLEQEKGELREALDQVRDYVFHLRPSELEGLDFLSVLKGSVSDFSERTGFKTEVTSDSSKIDLSSAGKMVLLRIVQESLSNIAKHSHADNVVVALKQTPQGFVVCTISDDGVGFDLSKVVEQMGSKRNYGLQSMKERAEAVGGEVEVESAPGAGTSVTVAIPGPHANSHHTAKWSLFKNGVRSVMRSRRTRKIIESGSDDAEKSNHG